MIVRRLSNMLNTAIRARGARATLTTTTPLVNNNKRAAIYFTTGLVTGSLFSSIVLSNSKKNSHTSLTAAADSPINNLPDFKAPAKEAGSTSEKNLSKLDTAKPKKERLVTKLIKEAAKEQGLKCETYSKDWIIALEDPVTHQVHYIWGYSFGLNSQVASMLCNDKSALSDVLTRANIPHVEHRIFLNPNMKDWSPDTGIFTEMLDYAKQHNYQIVVKPKDGSGGVDVYHCKNTRELEAAAIKLFSKAYSLVISPYEKIEQEYRVVMLDNEPRLIFQKERPSLIGDGKSTIRQLIQASISQDPKVIDNFLDSEGISKNIKLDQVPANKEIIPILWKHNLASGAKASTDVDQKDKQVIVDLAIKAAKTVGVRFSSVDIVKSNGSFKVLEINSGVMMEKAPTFIKNGEEVARSIYSDAIHRMFHPPAPTIASNLTPQNRPLPEPSGAKPRL